MTALSRAEDVSTQETPAVVTRGIGSTVLTSACELAGSATAAQAESTAPSALVPPILALLMSESSRSVLCVRNAGLGYASRGRFAAGVDAPVRVTRLTRNKPACGQINAVSATRELL